MKRLLTFTIIIFLFLDTQGQVKKVYGYLQTVTAGAEQAGELPTKNHEEIEELRYGAARYFLFVDIKRNATVSIEQVWIKARHFDFKTDTVKELPFVLKSFSGPGIFFSDTLVKSTLGTVVQLTGLVKSDGKLREEKLRPLIEGNDVVIIFRCRKKLFTKTLKRLISIRPVFAQ